MAEDTEALTVELRAKIDQFEKAIQRANKAADKNLGDIEKRTESFSKRFSESFEKAGDFGKDIFGELVRGAVPAVAAVVGIGAAFEQAKAAVEDFSKINDESHAAGLDPEFFQGIAYQAQLGGVGMDQMSAALEAFNKNSGLAAEGAGRMATQLKALDPELLRSLQLASSQSERVKLVADAIAKQTDASKAAAISTAAFGDAGQKLVDVFSSGRKGIEETAAAARSMGIIVSDNLISQADELGDRFDTASKAIDVQFKEALIQIAPLLVSTANGVASLAHAVNVLLQQFESLEDRSTEVLTTRLAQIKTLLKANSEQPDLSKVPIGGKIPLGNRMTVHTAMSAEQAKAMQDEQSQIEAILAARKAAADAANRAGGKPGTIPTDPAQAKQEDRIKSITASLNRQLDALHQTDREQQVANELADAHVTASSKEGRALAELTGRLYDQRKALDANNDAANELSQIGANALTGWLTGTQTLTAALADMAKQLALTVLQAELLGTGPLAGILGTAPATSGAPAGLLGGAASSLLGMLHLAGGGSVSGPGGPTDDRVPAMLSAGEFVVNAGAAAQHSTLLQAINSGRLQHFANGGPVSPIPSMRQGNENRLQAGGGGGVTIHAPITFQGSAGTPDQNEDMARRVTKHLESTVRGIAADEILKSQRVGNIGYRRK